MVHRSRRAFIGQAAALTGGTLLARRVFAASRSRDASRFALLSDPHVAEDPAATRQGCNMTAKLGTATDQVLALEPLPAALLVAGDLAAERGTAGDYAQLERLLRPVREGGSRSTSHSATTTSVSRSAPPSLRQVDRPLPERQAYVLESPFVDWYLLDSLEPGAVPGRLGEAQLRWLATALDARRDKPAFLLLHHPPSLKSDSPSLSDTAALLPVLSARPQVKALFFGHTHAWSAEQREGLWGVNVPSVSYSFDPAQPTGWLDVRVARDAAEVVLNSHDPAHPRHGERVAIPLRPQAA